MERKSVSGMMLALIFMMLLTLGLPSDITVVANPIPIPSLKMPEEHINATISRVDGMLLAGVNGSYPFENLGYYSVTMYYPVPSDACQISVVLNDTSMGGSYPLDWVFSDLNYPTIIGDFPMIYWEILPVPDRFTIETYYEHLVPLTKGNYTFLYAMGTGKYLDYYAKVTTAYVSVSISKDVAYSEDSIGVYTITEEGMWKPANYTITQNDEIWMVRLTVVSEEFHPLVEDLLVTIRTIPGDVNGNGKVDVLDAAAISAHWYPGPPIGPSGYNPNFDINNDGSIDILDATIVSAYWTGPPKGPLAP